MPRSPSQHGTQSRVAPNPEDPTLLVGQVLDSRYRLTALVGRGGMGAVFRAEHVTIRRPVAVKLLVPSLAAIPELARRFEREAFAIGRIDHPNCVSVTDFGRLGDGSLYLVMEYLPGRSLADAIEGEGRIAARRALHILRHVLRGLGHAHQAGIVHRDVKPENVILVEQDGVPDFAKVLDFGIARVLGQDLPDAGDSSDRLTQAGVAFGTPAYMSPEQAIGDPVDPRADLYSATVMLFEMVTGRPPFYSPDKLELLGMHATRPPPGLSDSRPDLIIPPALDDLVAVGLSKRPAERFPDAETYIATIEACLLERMDGDFAYPALRDDTEPVALSRSTGGVRRPLTPLGPLATPSAGVPRVPAPGIGGAIRRHPLVTSALAAAAAGAAIAAYLLLRAPKDVNLLAGLKSQTATQAEHTLDQGDPAETIEMLKNRPALLTGDAQAQLQLGNAHAARSEYAAALKAYAGALAIDPQVISDPRMVANLRIMFDGSGPVHLEAARILAEQADDPQAKSRIAQLASVKDRGLRKKAFALAEKLNLGDQVNREQAFIYDLAQEPTCPERRDVVTRLRALGDPRAIAPLKAAINRIVVVRVGRKHRRRRRHVNACLHHVAADTIRYLSSLKAGGAAAPPVPSHAGTTGDARPGG